MLQYNFLVLSTVFLIPGLLIWAIRADLRPHMLRMAIISLPFAFTERLFYPDYWKPVFLFDLGRHIGFGIEDFLFVIALAWIASTAWAVVTGRTISPSVTAGTARRLAIVFAALGSLVLLTHALGIPVIFGACLAMVIVCGVVWVVRRDLVIPGLGGGAVCAGVYMVLCLVVDWLLPDFFLTAWRTDHLLGVRFLTIPVEELIYGFASGTAATSLYPFVTGATFFPQRQPNAYT